MKKFIFTFFVAALMLACSDSTTKEANASAPAKAESNVSDANVSEVAVVEGVVVVSDENGTNTDANASEANATVTVVEAVAVVSDANTTEANQTAQ